MRFTKELKPFWIVKWRSVLTIKIQKFKMENLFILNGNSLQSIKILDLIKAKPKILNF